jgi:hypothetical protein
MNIHKSQLFWCSPGVQGFDTLPYIRFRSESEWIRWTPKVFIRWSAEWPATFLGARSCQT